MVVFIKYLKTISCSVRGDTVYFSSPICIEGEEYASYQFDDRKTQILIKDKYIALRYAIEQIFRYHGFYRVRTDGVEAKKPEQYGDDYSDYVYWKIAIPDISFYPTEKEIIENSPIYIEKDGSKLKTHPDKVIYEFTSIKFGTLKKRIINDRNERLERIRINQYNLNIGNKYTTCSTQNTSSGNSQAQNIIANDESIDEGISNDIKDIASAILDSDMADLKVGLHSLATNVAIKNTESYLKSNQDNVEQIRSKSSDEITHGNNKFEDKFGFFYKKEKNYTDVDRLKRYEKEERRLKRLTLLKNIRTVIFVIAGIIALIVFISSVLH